MTTEQELSARSPRPRLLVVDDEATARRALASLLTDDGYHVEVAESAAQALGMLAVFRPDVLLTDVRMPGMDGIELLVRARALDPGLDVVVMTAFATVRDAVGAMRAGARHYVTKPIDVDELSALLRQVIGEREGGLRGEGAPNPGHREGGIGGLLGTSTVMQTLVESILQVAPSRATVLLTGESGTGKELVARALHDASPRRTGPFVTVHCAALAETLLQSELFGHERGAFTGAIARREGRFKMADGGTLLLDEIAEISPASQVMLLRVLQERAFERVGGNETLRVDVRIVAATNRELAGLVRAGRFREDLYYRLNVVGIRTPPLRAHRSDIARLAEHFLRRFAAEGAKALAGFTPEATAAMVTYDWPGNVRELENAVERAAALCAVGRVGLEHLRLPTNSASIHPPSEPSVALAPDELGPAPAFPGAPLADITRHAILATLAACDGNTHRAAAALGVSVRMVQYRLREFRHGIVRNPVGSTPSNRPPKGDRDDA